MRFAALFKSASASPAGCFHEAQALLVGHPDLALRPDPTRPRVLHVASPKTHKTGSSTLSSIFFRFAVRHKLRMFHRGEWSFLPGGSIGSSLKVHSVSSFLSQHASCGLARLCYPSRPSANMPTMLVISLLMNADACRI